MWGTRRRPGRQWGLGVELDQRGPAARSDPDTIGDAAANNESPTNTDANALADADAGAHADTHTNPRPNRRAGASPATDRRGQQRCAYRGRLSSGSRDRTVGAFRGKRA